MKLSQQSLCFGGYIGVAKKKKDIKRNHTTPQNESNEQYKVF